MSDEPIHPATERTSGRGVAKATANTKAKRTLQVCYRIMAAHSSPRTPQAFPCRPPAAAKADGSFTEKLQNFADRFAKKTVARAHDAATRRMVVRMRRLAQRVLSRRALPAAKGGARQTPRGRPGLAVTPWDELGTC